MINRLSFKGFSLRSFVLVFAALLANCTTDQAGDPCAPPVILELIEAGTGDPISGAQILATNLDRTKDSSVIEWDVAEKIYRIFGSAGTYQIKVSHSEYQEIFLDSLKVEETGKGDDDHALKTLTLRIEVSKKNDSSSLSGKPFRVMEIIAAPRC